MDRRILAAFLHFAHLFLAGLVISVVTMVIWVLGEMIASVAPSPGQGFIDPVVLYFVAVLLVLSVWWGGFLVFGLVRIRRAMREAMSGDFAGANARLRWMFDREPWLRIAGMNGSVWRQARVVEAYNDYLHGLHHDAIELALPESRGMLVTPLKRAAATVVAAAAADMGDVAAFELIAKHVARAKKKPRHPASQGILGGEGVAWGMQLRFADARARAEELLAADAGSRTGLVLRAFVRASTGETEAALADIELAAASPALAKAKPHIRTLTTSLLGATRAELLRERGRLEEAAATASGLAPVHRTSRLMAAAIPGLAAAVAGDAARAALAVDEINRLREIWSFEPIFRARSALAIARIERARGSPERALAILGDAVACPLALLRQEGLLEQAEARTLLGDSNGAEAALRYVLDISTETRQAKTARERLGLA